MDARFETFTVLINKISRSVRRIKTEEMSEFNLKAPHVSCLYYIYKEKTLTSKRLCFLCDEDKAAVSRAIDYLSSQGLLTRFNGEGKYKTPFNLTEKGMSVAKAVSDKIDGILNLAGDGLSEEERKIFYKNLKLISDNLEKICNKY